VTGEGRTVGNYSGTASAVQVIPSNVTGGGFEADLPTSSTGLSFLAKLNGVTVFNVDSGGVVHPSGIANTGNMTNTGVIASTGDISTSGNLNVVNGTVTALGAQFGNNGISAIAGDAPLGVALQAHKASTTSVTSSTVMFPDPDLFFSFSGAGGSSYFVEFFLSYNSGATGKFTTQWSVGGSATISSTARNAQGLDSTVSNATPAGIMRSGQHGYTTSVTYGDRAGTASLYAYECGTVTLSSGGPCQVGLSFAQSVSNATPVNLVTGSYARLTRIS
jgi:hypothetical protein